MGLLSLVGRISLNAGSYFSTLGDVEKGTSKTVNKIRNQLVGAVGAGFGINAIRRRIGRALDQSEEITRLAESLDLTTREAQQLKGESDRTGKSISEMAKNVDTLEANLERLRGSDVIFSTQQIQDLKRAKEIIDGFNTSVEQEFANLLENPLLLIRRMVFPLLGTDIGGPEPTALTQRQEAFLEQEAARKRQATRDREDRQEQATRHQALQDEIVKLEKEIAKTAEQNRVSGLTDEQKMNELLERRAKLEHDILFALTEEDQLRIRLQQHQNEADIIKQQRDGLDTRRDRDFLKPISMTDSLSAVGNFLGRSPDSPQVRALGEQTKVLRAIENNTRSREGTRFPL